jgi:hypothetical protein
MSDLVTVGNYFDRLSAELAKGVLDVDGIDAYISADDAGGMRPSLLTASGGARLVVRAEDAGRASELLRASALAEDSPAADATAV